MNCHYDLSGNTFGDRCPECGWDVGDSIQEFEIYTRYYARGAISAAVFAVLTAVVPGLGLFCAFSSWRAYRTAGDYCAQERVQDAQWWFGWARIAVGVAMIAAIFNAWVTVEAAIRLARWAL